MAVLFLLTTETFLLADLDFLTIEVFLGLVDLAVLVLGLTDTIVLLDVAIEGFLTVTVLLMFLLGDNLFLAGVAGRLLEELLVLAELTERFGAAALVFVLLLTVGLVGVVLLGLAFDCTVFARDALLLTDLLDAPELLDFETAGLDGLPLVRAGEETLLLFLLVVLV